MSDLDHSTSGSNENLTGLELAKGRGRVEGLTEFGVPVFPQALFVFRPLRSGSSSCIDFRPGPAGKWPAWHDEDPAPRRSRSGGSASSRPSSTRISVDTNTHGWSFGSAVRPFAGPMDPTVDRVRPPSTGGSPSIAVRGSMTLGLDVGLSRLDVDASGLPFRVGCGLPGSTIKVLGMTRHP